MNFVKWSTYLLVLCSVSFWRLLINIFYLFRCYLVVAIIPVIQVVNNWINIAFVHCTRKQILINKRLYNKIRSQLIKVVFKEILYITSVLILHYSINKCNKIELPFAWAHWENTIFNSGHILLKHVYYLGLGMLMTYYAYEQEQID